MVMYSDDDPLEGAELFRQVVRWIVGLSVFGLILISMLYNCFAVTIPQRSNANRISSAQWHRATATVSHINAVVADNMGGTSDVVQLSYPDWSGDTRTRVESSWPASTQVGTIEYGWVSRTGSFDDQSYGANPGDGGTGQLFGAFFGSLIGGLVLGTIGGLGAAGLSTMLILILLWLYEGCKYWKPIKAIRAWFIAFGIRRQNRKRTPKPSAEVRAAQHYEAELSAMVQTDRVKKALKKTRKLIQTATDRDNTRALDITALLKDIQNDVELDLQAHDAAELELADRGL